MFDAVKLYPNPGGSPDCDGPPSCEYVMVPTAFAPPPNSYSIVVNANVGVGVLLTQTI